MSKSGEIIKNKQLKVIFNLINKFIYKKNDFIISSLDLYIFLKFNFYFLFDNGIFEKYRPTIKIFFSESNIKFHVNKKYYGIPVFPSLGSIYYKLYEKIINMYNFNKIDFVILKDKDYNKLKKYQVEKFDNFLFSDLNFFIDNLIKELKFKLGVLEGINDIYDILLKIQFLYKALSFYNYDEYKKDIVNIYKELDLMFGREYQFEGGNINKSNYTGTARILKKDQLSVSNEVINTFYKGDIIIAQNTSVSYMKYITKSGGIVTINNNKLSHASIVSNELGLPLVLGAEGVFLKIFDGDFIKINSRNGKIKILKRFRDI